MAVLPAYTTLPDSTLAPKAVVRKFALAGLGTCGDQVIDPSTGTIVIDTSNCAGTPYDTSQVNPLSTTPPQSSSDPWAGLFNTLAKGGLDIAKLFAIQPGTVLTPQGGISMQNPGYPVTGTVGSVTNSLTNMLPLLLIGGLGIFLISSMGGRR